MDVRRAGADRLVRAFRVVPFRRGGARSAPSLGAGSPVLWAVVLGLAAQACGSDATGPAAAKITDLPRPLGVSERAVIQASNAFAFDLLREIAAREEKPNLFISPLSASMALGMTLNGADGDTYEAMSGTLRFEDLSRAEINRAYLDLITLLRGLDPLVELGIGNSIWYREGFPVEAAFLDTVRHYFGAGVAGLDFADPAAAEVINGWVEDETRGKIERIVEPPIDPGVVMFLINAIYFNGTWTYEFDPGLTEEAPFTRTDGTVTPVRMMSLQGGLPYVATDTYQAVDLPYGGEAFAMTVVLPREGVSLDELIGSLDAAGWNAMLADLAAVEVQLFLPRFKLEYEKKLNDPLIALGMGIAFSGEADFSRIAPDRELAISEVKQKTFVEVDEKGTEAAAVTVVVIVETSAGPHQPVVFRADRPFLFAVRERLSGTILFIGRFGAPPPA